MNEKRLFEWGSITVLYVFLAVVLISCLGDVQIEEQTASSSQQETLELLPNSVCEVHEGESIKAALNDVACTAITVHAGDYRGEGWYKFERSGVTLQAEGEVIISTVIIYGDNNILRGSLLRIQTKRRAFAHMVITTW